MRESTVTVFRKLNEHHKLVNVFNCSSMQLVFPRNSDEHLHMIWNAFSVDISFQSLSNLLGEIAGTTSSCVREGDVRLNAKQGIRRILLAAFGL